MAETMTAGTGKAKRPRKPRTTLVTDERRAFILKLATEHPEEGVTMNEILRRMVAGKTCPGKCPGGRDPEKIRPSIQKITKELVEAGELEIVGGRGKSTFYKMVSQD